MKAFISSHALSRAMTPLCDSIRPKSAVGSPGPKIRRLTTPACDASDSSWPGSVSNSLRAGKITGNLRNYGLLRRFLQPVGEKVQLLAAKFPEPSEQGSFFVLTGNSSSRTGNLRDRAASCQAASVAPRAAIVHQRLRDIGDGVSKIRVMSKPVGLRRGSVRLLEP
jgi:hypothetical protein